MLGLLLVEQVFRNQTEQNRWGAKPLCLGLGGLFLGLAEVLSIAYIGSDMRDAVAFGFLFLVLLLRPKGLFGSLQERKV